MIAIVNTTRETRIADKAVMADTFLSRMVGLLNRASLPPGEALIITRCQSIHMFFMHFAIDAIFVNKDKRIVGLVRNLKPFRLSPVFFQSSYVIEAPEGSIVQSRSALGDKIELGLKQ